MGGKLTVCSYIASSTQTSVGGTKQGLITTGGIGFGPTKFTLKVLISDPLAL
jgi:hypothetical protein